MMPWGTVTYVVVLIGGPPVAPEEWGTELAYEFDGSTPQLFFHPCGDRRFVGSNPEVDDGLLHDLQGGDAYLRLVVLNTSCLLKTGWSGIEIWRITKTYQIM